MDVMLTLTWHVFFLTNHQNSNTKISTFEKTEVSVFFCIGYFAFRDGFFCSVLSPSLLRQRVVGVIVSVETAVLYKGDREKYQQYSLLILLTLNFGPIYIYVNTPFSFLERSETVNIQRSVHLLFEHSICFHLQKAVS